MVETVVVVVETVVVAVRKQQKYVLELHLWNGNKANGGQKDDNSSQQMRLEVEGEIVY